jgi:hypothetical protein
MHAALDPGGVPRWLLPPMPSCFPASPAAAELLRHVELLWDELAEELAAEGLE